MIEERALDHIVYAVPDLDEACERFEKLLGVKPVFGGYHQTQGTKNALIGLGDGQYLELLAIDASNKKIQPPRWMGVDLLTKPQITRWAVKSEDLGNDFSVLESANPSMGQRSVGSRKTSNGDLLAWELLMPLATPEVELIPFMIDWSVAENHPSNQLFTECKLIELYATHPAPDNIISTLQELNVSVRIEVDEDISIKAKIECPKGIIVL